MMASKSIKACRVAQDEIIQGRVTYVVQKVTPKPPIEPGI